MTLQEALRGYDWIPDPAIKNRARIAGPDNDVAIVVEEDDTGKLRCWLWCPKTNEMVEGVQLVTNQVIGLTDVIDELYTMREFLGDCSRCGTPMGLRDGQAACPLCGRNGKK